MTKKPKAPIVMSVRDYNLFTGRKPDDTYVHRLIRNGKELPFVAKYRLINPSVGSNYYQLTMVADFSKTKRLMKHIEPVTNTGTRKQVIKSLAKKK